MTGQTVSEVIIVLLAIAAIIWILYHMKVGISDKKALEEINKVIKKKEAKDEEVRKDLLSRREQLRDFARRMRNNREANANKVSDTEEPMS